MKEKLSFAKAVFLNSASSEEHYPSLRDKRGQFLPEIALVGRSNVGKSSLLNHLTHQKNLARVSSTPGKTQLINFFSVDEKLTLVDLPGYGYAKISKSIRQSWANLIQTYLEKRKLLELVLLLCDCRHPPTKDDLLFAEWAKHYQKPLLLIFTKTDKLNKGAILSTCEKHSRNFTFPIPFFPYSIKDPKSREGLIKEIEKRLAL